MNYRGYLRIFPSVFCVVCLFSSYCLVKLSGTLNAVFLFVPCEPELHATVSNTRSPEGEGEGGFEVGYTLQPLRQADQLDDLPLTKSLCL